MQLLRFIQQIESILQQIIDEDCFVSIWNETGHTSKSYEIKLNREHNTFNYQFNQSRARIEYALLCARSKYFNELNKDKQAFNSVNLTEG